MHHSQESSTGRILFSDQLLSGDDVAAAVSIPWRWLGHGGSVDDASLMRSGFMESPWRCYALGAFAFVAVFSFFRLVLWGASRSSYKPHVVVKQQQHHHHRFVVALLVLLLAPLVAGDIQGKECGATSYFSGNSTYEQSLDLLAAILPRKAASSSTLFATATTGSVPDAVHGLAQCRGDVDASTCAACLTGAMEDARQLCVDDKDATVYYDRCVLRYSNLDFLLDDGFGDAVVYKNNTDSGDGFATIRFDADLRYLVTTVADHAARSSTRFATGVLQLPGEEVFGLAQCTPDMAQTDCRRCLAYLLTVVSTGPTGPLKTGSMHFLRCFCMYGASRFFSGSPSVRLPTQPSPASTHGKSSKHKTMDLVLEIALPVAAAAVLTGAILLWMRRKRNRGPLLPDIFNSEDIKSINSLSIPLSTLRTATGNFNIGNLIGQGGFGPVYKGILPGSNQEIAVKKLSESSRQGMEELRNEIVSVAKLRHRNLAKLIGVCLEGQEKLIVYEFLPKGSLDKIIFNTGRRSQLGPEKVMDIIAGIARGLQYIHEDSEAQIVHRDLKASNVLLDHQLNPKISDFGLARILEGGQSHDVTSRAAGTFGYMAPERWASSMYSFKSDVYSFGILVLEIVTGKRNDVDLVWDHWDNGTVMDIVVGSSSLSSSSSEMMRRCLQVGLLCIQHNPADRPSMTEVNMMLKNNSNTLPQPSRATLPAVTSPGPAGASTGSHNNVTITELEPR